MSSRTTIFLIAILALILILAGALSRPLMGDALATHWNAQGQADGYGSDFTALYLLPLTILGITLLVLGLPLIDPLRANVESFRRDLNSFVLATALFLAYLHALTLVWNLGYTFNFNQAITPGFSFVLFLIGGLLARARRNFFIGIRTPWTLSSDLVWESTHRQGGKLFKAAALVSLAGIIFPRYAMFLVIVPLLTATLVVILYSYLQYRNLARTNR